MSLMGIEDDIFVSERQAAVSMIATLGLKYMLTFEQTEESLKKEC